MPEVLIRLQPCNMHADTVMSLTMSFIMCNCIPCHGFPGGIASNCRQLIVWTVGAVGGSVDSGKSTLIAVLSHGADSAPILDDGAGRARTRVFRHKHEVQTGHTSSISQALLGYDADGRVLNYTGTHGLTAVEISAAADKVLHFIDLGGHARFLKTALYGVAPPTLAVVCPTLANNVGRLVCLASHAWFVCCWQCLTQP